MNCFLFCKLLLDDSDEDEIIEELVMETSSCGVVCTSMKPTGVIEDQIKLRAFPFSLKDSLRIGSIIYPPRVLKHGTR